MSNLPRCQLTTKDFSILEALLEGDVQHDEAFLRLLRRKLSTANVVFQVDIRPDVATINSRIEFTVDGELIDRGTLVDGAGDGLPGPVLPITTIRGLALLGLSEGEALVVERSDGGNEEIRLDKLCHQPETPGRAAVEQQSSVVAFEARRKTAPVRLDDDDPGPSAA